MAATDVDVPHSKTNNPMLANQAERERVAGGMGMYQLWKCNTSTHLQASKRSGNFQISLGLASVMKDN